MIFDYSLSPADEDYEVEGSSSSGRLSEDDDIFFRVSKDMLTDSDQFSQIINPKKESQPMRLRGQRLAIM